MHEQIWAYQISISKLRVSLYCIIKQLRQLRNYAQFCRYVHKSTDALKQSKLLSATIELKDCNYLLIKIAITGNKLDLKK